MIAITGTARREVAELLAAASTTVLHPDNALADPIPGKPSPGTHILTAPNRHRLRVLARELIARDEMPGAVTWIRADRERLRPRAGRDGDITRRVTEAALAMPGDFGYQALREALAKADPRFARRLNSRSLSTVLYGLVTTGRLRVVTPRAGRVGATYRVA